MRKDKIACHCHNVTYGQIEQAVKNGARSLEAVMAKTTAGTGCGKCREFLPFLIRDIIEEVDAAKPK